MAPYKKRRFKKKTTYRRKPRRKAKSTVSTVSAGNPFPAKYIAKLRYQEQVQVDPAAAGLGVYAFRANSPFDPNYTGAGHQPRYFDQLMSTYEHYVVLGSKITCICSNSQNETLNFAIQQAPDTSVPTTWNEVVESRNCRFTTVNEQTGGGSVKTLSYTYSPKKALGRSAWDPDLRGGAASNPQEMSYYNCIISPFNEANNAAATILSVIIDYTVAFTEPKRVGQS